MTNEQKVTNIAIETWLFLQMKFAANPLLLWRMPLFFHDYVVEKSLPGPHPESPHTSTPKHQRTLWQCPQEKVQRRYLVLGICYYLGVDTFKYPETQCMVYLPTKLGNLKGVDVSIEIHHALSVWVCMYILLCIYIYIYIFPVPIPREVEKAT